MTWPQHLLVRALVADADTAILIFAAIVGLTLRRLYHSSHDRRKIMRAAIAISTAKGRCPKSLLHPLKSLYFGDDAHGGERSIGANSFALREIVTIGDLFFAKRYSCRAGNRDAIILALNEYLVAFQHDNIASCWAKNSWPPSRHQARGIIPIGAPQHHLVIVPSS